MSVDRTAPFVATKKGKCGDWRCVRPIVRGDIVVRYADQTDEGTPQHVEHWLKELTDRARRAEFEASRNVEVAHDVLAFCGGLSAVNADWIGRQWQRLRAT